ncbi:MAG TPA: DUF6268 family outer membrane beta-barrel protein [Desulfuromonadaceae bacterium]
MKRALGPGLLCAALVLFATVAAASSVPVSQEVDLESGIVAGAAARPGTDSPRELTTDLRYVVSPQITNNLLLRLGAEWERFGFAASPASAVPDTLQHVNAIVGFDYQLADQWLMRAEVQPGVYGDFRQTGWRQVDVPLVIGAAYLKSADLQWFFGLRVDAKSQLPVLPAFGFRWQMDETWTLNMQLPQPRVEYGINGKHLAYLGAVIKAGTFTVGERFGSDRGNPRLNGATVDYTEVRVGPGWSWKVLPTATIEAEAGYAPWRIWDFFDQNVQLHSSPAPYLQLGCHLRF